MEKRKKMLQNIRLFHRHATKILADEMINKGRQWAL